MKKIFKILIVLVIFIGSVLFTALLKKRRQERVRNLVTEAVYKVEDINWVSNSFNDLIFNTPEKTFNKNNEEQIESSPGIGGGVTSFLEVDGILFYVMYLKINSLEYDISKGLNGVVTETVKGFNGENLDYNLILKEYEWVKYGESEGSFSFKGSPVIFKAFLTFSEELKEERVDVRSLMVLADKSENNLEIINETIESIDLDHLNDLNNPLSWFFNDRRKERNSISKKNGTDSGSTSSFDELMRYFRGKRDSTKDKTKSGLPPTYEDFKKMLEKNRSSNDDSTRN
ncbi:hypothetical protein [Algoriphagus sediminis]|uniref:Uncharacterized protein n=1 Tax=Algoriphagus sediminis TaxID=3057113 RepID=A0ABT7YH30_9BACT|nr:hypothetical protein [Algoriphagus sediminis]MDN3205665.1 hypothetical protein [Algoriphagus sediminis]